MGDGMLKEVVVGFEAAIHNVVRIVRPTVNIWIRISLYTGTVRMYVPFSVIAVIVIIKI